MNILQRRLTIGGIFGILLVLFLLWLFSAYDIWRIKHDVGITDSPFAVAFDENGTDPEMREDVAVANISPRDAERLMHRFVWTPINNTPWWEWQSATPPPTYDGIPWYTDLLNSRDLYPITSKAAPGTDADGPFLHAWFVTSHRHYDLVFQKRRNLLWIVATGRRHDSPYRN